MNSTVTVLLLCKSALAVGCMSGWSGKCFPISKDDLDMTIVSGLRCWAIWPELIKKCVRPVNHLHSYTPNQGLRPKLSQANGFFNSRFYMIQSDSTIFFPNSKNDLNSNKLCPLWCMQLTLLSILSGRALYKCISGWEQTKIFRLQYSNLIQ